VACKSVVPCEPNQVHPRQDGATCTVERVSATNAETSFLLGTAVARLQVGPALKCCPPTIPFAAGWIPRRCHSKVVSSRFKIFCATRFHSDNNICAFLLTKNKLLQIFPRSVTSCGTTTAYATRTNKNSGGGGGCVHADFARCGSTGKSMKLMNINKSHV